MSIMGDPTGEWKKIVCSRNVRGCQSWRKEEKIDQELTWHLHRIQLEYDWPGWKQNYYLGEDAQTIVCLLISGSAHVGNVAGHFRRKHSTKRVPDVTKIALHVTNTETRHTEGS